ncbi:L-alanine exporter AlaE, partial [Salmonella enterica subsp. enterica serovar Kentucky]|nr:L-alanine exporter AlaE [Salmonella enterica subsp. enterica serovar Kentucky]
QSPVYIIILLTVGASWHQIVAAVSSNIVVSMLMGAVYGYFLEGIRVRFPGAEEPVTRWQGNLTPVVNYF